MSCFLRTLILLVVFQEEFPARKKLAIAIFKGLHWGVGLKWINCRNIRPVKNCT